MKILLFTDVHWSKTSSIIRDHGNNYTTRLEHLIKGMNWVNELAQQENCDFMICAGDMMDKSSCTDMEITSIKDIKWNDKKCYFLCGNHESSVSDLRYSSLKLLESNNHFIIDKTFNLDFEDCQIHFIPYVVESERLSIDNYITNVDKSKKQIIISHNDIMGIKYGGFESKVGFSIDEIEKYSDLYLNGHLHNTSWITNKILNLGSLSAHNFTNNSLMYKYGAWILDTNTLKMTFYENPYAFKFYSFEIDRPELIELLDSTENNAVISIKCSTDLVNQVKEKVSTKNNILTYRITTMANTLSSTKVDRVEDFTMNHLEKFVQCVKEKIGTNAIIDFELNEVIK